MESKLLKPFFCVFYSLIASIFIACSIRSQKRCSDKEVFDEFYSKYYEDSSFQIERVVFPLPGFNLLEHNPNLTQKVDTNYYWTKDEWGIHYTIDGDSVEVEGTIYKKRIVRSDSIVYEQIYIEGGGYFVENKFQLIENKWYLVFYYYSPDW